MKIIISRNNIYTKDFAVSDTELRLNSVPTGGTLTVSPQGGVALLTTFSFSFNNFLDEDIPFSYRLLLYFGESYYQKDI